MKKYLRKNEFRIDKNPAHYGEKKEPHPAYITARYGHRYKANSITHAKTTNDGRNTYNHFSYHISSVITFYYIFHIF